MLTVTHNGQSEPLTRVIRGSYQKKWELNGELSLSLESIAADDNPGHALLQEGAVITTVDGLEFRAFKPVETRRGAAVDALSTFFDLGGVIKHEIFGGSKTLQAFADWVLAGTGWRAEVVDVTGSKLVANFGNGENALKLIEQLLAAFECEREILPGNVIRFAKKIGPSKDHQFRVGHNAKSIRRTVDTTGVRTSITGYGGNGLVVTYTSPNADKFPWSGEAEPIKDDRYTVRESLLERLQQELNDTPAITVDVDTVEVGDVYPGETVWAIDDKLDMVLETRVIAFEETDPARPRYGRVTLGNTTRKKLEDNLVDQDVSIGDVDDKVEVNRRQSETKFEQTNEHILATANALEKYTDERYGEVQRDMAAQWEITAESIKQGVQESKGYTDSRELIIRDALTAAENRWGDDLSNIGEQITTIDGKVATMVDELGTLDTELGTLQGDVVAVREEFSSRIDETARQITLEVTGAIEYADAVAADALTSANGYTDGQVTTVRSEASANFTTLAGRINAKADATTVSGLGTRVSTVERDMNAVTGQISDKVSYTDYNGQEIISRVNQTASTWKVQAKNIQLDGITEVAGRLQVGNASNPATRLEFYNGGFYQPYIGISSGVYGSGMELFASDIHLNAADHLYLGSGSSVDVFPNGTWDWSGVTHKNLNITAVAVLG